MTRKLVNPLFPMQLLQTDTILSKEEFSERNDPMSLYENIMAAMLLLVWAGSRGEDVRIQQKRQFCSEQVSFPFFFFFFFVIFSPKANGYRNLHNGAASSLLHIRTQGRRLGVKLLPGDPQARSLCQGAPS